MTASVCMMMMMCCNGPPTTQLQTDPHTPRSEECCCVQLALDENTDDIAVFVLIHQDMRWDGWHSVWELARLRLDRWVSVICAYRAKTVTL